MRFLSAVSSGGVDKGRLYNVCWFMFVVAVH